MKRKTRHTLIKGLIMFIVTLAIIEAALWHIDPVGVVAYFADLNALQSHSLPAEDGYRYTPGDYCFRKYCAEIGADGLRVVPDTVTSDCTILFVGDSVSFGMGANRSYVDFLAPDLGANVRNGGLPGYSAANVAAMVQGIEAEGYVWLIIGNDADPAYTWRRGSGRLPSAITLYLDWLFPGDAAAVPDMALFARTAGPLLARDDVLAFTFEGAMLTTEAAAMGAQVIEQYRSVVSVRDAHPSDTGAAEIATAMRDDVMEFVEARCG